MRQLLLRAATMAGLVLHPAGGTALAEAISPEAASGYITELGNRAVSVLATRGNAEVRHDEFTRLMLDAIDFDAIAMATLGKMARTVSAAARREFTQLFAALVIDVAIERFGNSPIRHFTIDSARQLPNGDVKVHATIERLDEQPLSVDWRVRLTAGRPKINDIEVSGYSLVIHYRGEFERGSVSNVPGLIDRLKDMNKSSVALATVQRVLR